MREMKDSGVEWIGEMPAGWKTARVKNVAATMQSGGTPDSSNDSFYVDKEYGIPWVAIADMSATAYVTDTNKYISEDARHSKNLKVFPPGTILYAMYASVGKVAELAVPATINQALLAIELRNNINNSFFKYALNAWEPYIISESNGTTQNNLNASKVANLFVPLPCLQEQEILARLLDLRRTKVDTLIQNVQTQIEKLKAYKQSLITEVVTKGLDPTVPMKDSGVEWIGEIPECWNMITLGAITKEMRNGYVGPTRDLFVDNGVRYIQSLHTKDGLIDFYKHPYYVSEEWANQHPKVHTGDVLIVQTGDIGQVALVNDKFDGSNCHALIIATPNQTIINPEYLTYYLLSFTGKELMLSFKTGALLPHLNSSKIKSTPICVPDMDTQIRIVDYLRNKISSIETLIAIKQAKIEKLEQYKRSLIYEYVTGKKEII